MTTSASVAGLPHVAVSSANDLKCWCTFEASSPEELASHSQTHRTALSVSVGVSRCPKCRRRCKSSTDLQMHMRVCQATPDDLMPIDSCLESPANCTNYTAAPYGGDFEFPFQVDWDGSFGGLNSSGSSVRVLSSIFTFLFIFFFFNFSIKLHYIHLFSFNFFIFLFFFCFTL